MASRKRRAVNQLTKDSDENEKLSGEYGDASAVLTSPVDDDGAKPIPCVTVPISQRRIVKAARPSQRLTPRPPVSSQDEPHRTESKPEDRSPAPVSNDQVSKDDTSKPPDQNETTGLFVTSDAPTEKDSEDGNHATDIPPAPTVSLFKGFSGFSTSSGSKDFGFSSFFSPSAIPPPDNAVAAETEVNAVPHTKPAFSTLFTSSASSMTASPADLNFSSIFGVEKAAETETNRKD